MLRISSCLPTKKKAVVVVPTISLMEDPGHNLQKKKGISTAYLGSAQPDKSVEDRVFLESSPENINFVTPEWLAKPEHSKSIS